MNDVRIDTKKNRIYVTISGPDRASFKTVVDRIEECAIGLRPDFTCLNRIEVDGAFLLENRDLVERGQSILQEYGIGKAVRLVAKEQLRNSSLKILNVVFFGYQADFVAGYAEAERLLEQYRLGSERSRSSGVGEKALFKIIDPCGWEDRRRFVRFQEAMRRLRRVRNNGRRRAIIVDARVPVGKRNRP